MTAAGRLGIGIIGAGRVGVVLGAGFAAAGHIVTGIATVSEHNRDRARAMLPRTPILEIPEVVERGELIILAVPEIEIATLVSGLAATGAWQPGQLLLHTAPGLGCAVLQPALSAGAIPLAVHPAMSFTGTSMDLVRLRESYCAVTAPTPVLPIAQALVVELGAEPVVIAESDRPAYAEAIATATSFSASIVRQSVELLERIGLDSPNAVIAPLVRSVVENALATPATIEMPSTAGELGAQS